MLHHVDREQVLAHRVQWRYERDQQGRVAKDEQRPAQSKALVGVPEASKAPITERVGQANSDQRQKKQRIGLELRERRGLRTAPARRRLRSASTAPSPRRRSGSSMRNGP